MPNEIVKLVPREDAYAAYAAYALGSTERLSLLTGRRGAARAAGGCLAWRGAANGGRGPTPGTPRRTGSALAPLAAPMGVDCFNWWSSVAVAAPSDPSPVCRHIAAEPAWSRSASEHGGGKA